MADGPSWVRHPYALLTAVAVGWVAVRHGGPAADWPFLREGSDLLFGHRTQIPSATVSGASQLSAASGGLHLYAHYPQIQIGPLALVLVALVRVIAGPYGQVVTATLGTLLCVPAARLLVSTSDRLREAPRERAAFVLVGGTALLAVWTQATLTYGHVDDALVLFFSALAVVAVTRGDGRLLGLAIALAVSAKPTGLVLLPLLLAVSGRRRIEAAAVAAVGVALAWLPFVLADPRTLSAGSPTIITAQATALHVLGLHGYLTWVRLVQLAVSVAAGVVAVLRGRWTAALLVASTGRLLLEPGAISYYTAGIVLGALAWEALSARRPRGLVTAAVCAIVYLVPYQAVYSLLPYRPLLTGPLVGWLRLATCLALMAAVLALPRRTWTRLAPA